MDVISHSACSQCSTNGVHANISVFWFPIMFVFLVAIMFNHSTFMIKGERRLNKTLFLVPTILSTQVNHLTNPFTSYLSFYICSLNSFIISFIIMIFFHKIPKYITTCDCEQTINSSLPMVFLTNRYGNDKKLVNNRYS
jgi:Na+/H+ antiporter NhaC